MSHIIKNPQSKLLGYYIHFLLGSKVIKEIGLTNLTPSGLTNTAPKFYKILEVRSAKEYSIITILDDNGKVQLATLGKYHPRRDALLSYTTSWRLAKPSNMKLAEFLSSPQLS
jgi:hypothetical protein